MRGTEGMTTGVLRQVTYARDAKLPNVPDLPNVPNFLFGTFGWFGTFGTFDPGLKWKNPSLSKRSN